MPRPSLGRRTITVRLLPAALAELAPAPSEQAREVLEEWARNRIAKREREVRRGNASTSEGEPAEVEGAQAGKPLPGQSAAESGEMRPRTRRADPRNMHRNASRRKRT